jgi:hypothetical protein
MLTCTRACVRMRVIKNHAYRNGLKITSPNLANLASGFSSARRQSSVSSIQRTALRTDARSLANRPTLRLSHSSRQWANSGPHNASATMALTSPKRWVLPQKPPRSWAAGTAARLDTVCLFCPTPSSLAKGLHYDHHCFAD